MRLFFDANVLFAAAYNQSGTPYGLISDLSHLGCEGFTSEYAWAETYKNLSNKAPSKLENLENLKSHIRIEEFSPMLSDPIELKEKDIPIFRAALFYSCSVLVTGDICDFGELRGSSRRLIKIMTPKQCLEWLRQGRGACLHSL